MLIWGMVYCGFTHIKTNFTGTNMESPFLLKYREGSSPQKSWLMLTPWMMFSRSPTHQNSQKSCGWKRKHFREEDAMSIGGYEWSCQSFAWSSWGCLLEIRLFSVPLSWLQAAIEAWRSGSRWYTHSPWEPMAYNISKYWVPKGTLG